MSRNTIQTKIEQVRNETALYGNTRGRVADLLTMLNSEKLDRDGALALLAEISSIAPEFLEYVKAGHFVIDADAGFGGDLVVADDPAPTKPTWYFAKESGTYPNAGGLVVDLSGKLVILNFDGTTWSKVEVAMPEGKSDKPFTAISGTEWNGNNFITLTGNTALTTKSGVLNGYLFVSQDGTGGKTLTVNNFQVPISTAANAKVIVGYITVEGTVYFSVSDNLIAGGAAPDSYIIPTFTNTHPEFSTISPGVYEITAQQKAGVSNETLIGDGYIEIGTDVIKDVLIGLDSNNTLYNYNNGTTTTAYECFVDIAKNTGNVIYTNYKGINQNSILSHGSVVGIVKLRLRRTGTTVKLQKSTDGTNYTDMYTFPNPISGTLWVKVSSVIQVPCRTESLKIVNL